MKLKPPPTYNVGIWGSRSYCNSSSRWRTLGEVRPRQCPCLRAFESWSACGIRRTRRRSDDAGRHGFYPGSPPLLGNDLRPACLTLLMGWLQWWCLQWWRRLDLAECEELSRIRALRWMMTKSV
jgi:hypothetical protein